jgi:hypothetical protein
VVLFYATYTVLLLSYSKLNMAGVERSLSKHQQEDVYSCRIVSLLLVQIPEPRDRRKETEIQKRAEARLQISNEQRG